MPDGGPGDTRIAPCWVGVRVVVSFITTTSHIGPGDDLTGKSERLTSISKGGLSRPEWSFRRDANRATVCHNEERKTKC